MATATDYRSLFDREYVGAWELNGRDVTVTIASVKAGDLTTVGGRKSKKPIIAFEGASKKMICNKTNARTIAALYGTIVEAWVGKRITLYVGQTRDPSTGGGEVDCLRVRPKVPEGATQALEPPAESG